MLYSRSLLCCFRIFLRLRAVSIAAFLLNIVQTKALFTNELETPSCLRAARWALGAFGEIN